MRRAARALAILALAAAAAPVASAYYHWIFFAQRGGPFAPLRMRFDVNSLTDRTVRFFVPAQGPEPMMPGDSYTALISQIRRAAASWDGVTSSSLRVKWGGVVEPQEIPGAGQTAPGIDVVFDDEMPPGVLAQSLPVTLSDLSYLGQENSPGFAPILRSTLQLRRDLTARQQASYSDAFFLTIVHEFGHTLGLQHSLTSSAMSTSITRATTSARPLSADDVAAISLLYPVDGYAASTGVIAGRVNVDGVGVNLASVVALGVDGRAIGSLTNPDGTYRIEGLPPGDYRVYAHPLPPAQQDEGLPAAIRPPRDLAGEAFPATTTFETKFFPGTRDWTQAAVLTAGAGSLIESVDFDLASRAGPAIHSMQAYVFMGPDHNIAVHAATVPIGDRRFFGFTGPGVYQPNSVQFAPGLNFSAIGGPVRLDSGTPVYWQDGYSLLVINTDPVESPTPVAFAVTTADDLYVLPAALTVVPSAAPQVTSVTRMRDDNGQALAVLEGANLGPETRVLFDGVTGEFRTVEEGRLIVAAPPAAGKHEAGIAALDGIQSSSQILVGGAPPRFGYDAAENPSIAPRPGTLTAGMDMLVEVDGSATDFLAGSTVAGFGSSDVSVRQVWVINRNRLLLNVSVSPRAQPGLTRITVATGLQVASEWIAIGPRPEKEIGLRVPGTSVRTGLTGVAAGEAAFFATTGVPADLTGWSVRVHGVEVQAAPVEGGIHLTVPNSAPLGPVKVQLMPPDGRYIEPVLLQIDAPPPVITQVVVRPEILDRTEALPGDRVKIVTMGLFDELVGVAPAVARASVELKVGGIVHTIEGQPRRAAQGLGYELEFVLRGEVAAGVQPITVRVGTRQSYPASLSVRPGETAALAQ